MKLKYMGTSHVRRLEKGENFAGRLAEPLDKAVEWNFENFHIVDTEEVGLSEAAVELLLESTSTVYDSGPEVEEGERTDRTIHEFKDVSDKATVPSSLAQQVFLGHKATYKVEDLEAGKVTAPEPATAGSGGRAGRPTSRGAAGGGAAGGGTTVGGSTSGGGGDAGAGGGTGGAVGGSTTG